MSLYRLLLNTLLVSLLCHVASGFTNSLPVHKVQESSASELTAISPDVFLMGTALFSGAMVALNRNPDVLDSLIKQSNGMSTTPLPSAKKSSPIKKMQVSAKATPEKLTKLVGSVADDLEKSKPVAVKKKKKTSSPFVAKKKVPAVAAVQDSIFTEPVSDRVRQPVKQNSAFFRKLTKKTVMPWRQWSNL